MTSLGSLEQRRPDLVMISPGKTAAAVAAAADAISSERWQAGAELEVYSKKTETWRSGEIRSLPDEDMVEVVYTIDVPEPDTPRLKLCLRSSERLRWPKEEELLTITVRHDLLPKMCLIGLRFHADGAVVQVTGDASRKLGLNFGEGGCTFPVVESVAPDTLVAVRTAHPPASQQQPD